MLSNLSLIVVCVFCWQANVAKLIASESTQHEMAYLSVFAQEAQQVDDVEAYGFILSPNSLTEKSLKSAQMNGTYYRFDIAEVDIGQSYEFLGPLLAEISQHSIEKAGFVYDAEVLKELTSSIIAHLPTRDLEKTKVEIKINPESNGLLVSVKARGEQSTFFGARLFRP